MKFYVSWTMIDRLSLAVDLGLESGRVRAALFLVSKQVSRFAPEICSGLLSVAESFDSGLAGIDELLAARKAAWSFVDSDLGNAASVAAVRVVLFLLFPINERGDNFDVLWSVTEFLEECGVEERDWQETLIEVFPELQSL